MDWSRYTHIILPDGSWEGELPFAERLGRWVRSGGTLVAMRDAAPWVRALTLDAPPEGTENTDGPVESESAGDDDAAKAPEEPTERRDYADMDADDAVDVIGGAIFRADLDTTHPLGFGYAERDLFLHKNENEVFEPTDNAYGTVIAYTDDPLYSGYTSEDNLEELAGAPALIAERFGRGSVILFADNPNFRGYWYGTNKLFLNSLFFSTVFDAP